LGGGGGTVAREGMGMKKGGLGRLFFSARSLTKEEAKKPPGPETFLSGGRFFHSGGGLFSPPPKTNHFSGLRGREKGGPRGCNG